MNITFNIPPVAEEMREQIQGKIDHLNKPKGSLGLLEDTALQICMIQHTLEHFRATIDPPLPYTSGWRPRHRA